MIDSTILEPTDCQEPDIDAEEARELAIEPNVPITSLAIELVTDFNAPEIPSEKLPATA